MSNDDTILNKFDKFVAGQSGVQDRHATAENLKKGNLLGAMGDSLKYDVDMVKHATQVIEDGLPVLDRVVAGEAGVQDRHATSENLKKGNVLGAVGDSLKYDVDIIKHAAEKAESVFGNSPTTPHEPSPTHPGHTPAHRTEAKGKGL